MENRNKIIAQDDDYCRYKQGNSLVFKLIGTDICSTSIKKNFVPNIRGMDIVLVVVEEVYVIVNLEISGKNVELDFHYVQALISLAVFLIIQDFLPVLQDMATTIDEEVQDWDINADEKLNVEHDSLAVQVPWSIRIVIKILEIYSGRYGRGNKVIVNKMEKEAKVHHPFHRVV